MNLCALLPLTHSLQKETPLLELILQHTPTYTYALLLMYAQWN